MRKITMIKFKKINYNKIVKPFIEIAEKYKDVKKQSTSVLYEKIIHFPREITKK